MKINKIYPIIKKELKKTFDRFGGYILISIFLLLNYFFFLKTFFLNSELSLRGLFYNLSWILPVFVSALTMSSFSQEKDKSTIEYLLDKPIKIRDLVLGKILGVSKVASISVLLTLPLVFFMTMFGSVDFGEIFSSYLGAIVYILATASLGVAISSFFKDQILSFITTSVVLLFLNLLGTEFAQINLSLNLANFLATLGIFSHYDSFIRGVVRLGDLFYFIGMFLIGYVIAQININKIRFNNKLFAKYLRNIFLKTIGIVVAVIAILFLNKFVFKIEGLKFDLTANKRYSLSEVSKKILSQGDKIKITAYLSNDVPSQYQSLVRELKYILSDYQSASQGLLEVNYLSPSGNEKKMQEAGIQKMNFSIIGDDNFQQKTGYLGLVIENEDKLTKEPLNLGGNIDDNLDYVLTKIIAKLKNNKKTKVAYVSGDGLEKNFNTDYQAFSQLLKDEYDLMKVELPVIADEEETQEDEENELPDLSQYKMLIIAGLKKQYTVEAKDLIKNFYENGGSVLYLSDGMQINGQFNLAVANEDGAGRLFEDYGVVVDQGLLKDYQNALVVNLNDESGNSFLTKYPYWLVAEKVKSDEDQDFLPETIVLPWASKLSLIGEGWRELYQTSSLTKFQEATSSMTLDVADSEKINLGEGQKYTPAAMLENDKGGKLVVIANTGVFEDQFVSNPMNPQNLIFGLGLFENMSDSLNLSSIKARSLAANRFMLKPGQEYLKGVFRYGSVGMSFGILIIIGICRWQRVKNLSKRISDLDL